MIEDTISRLEARLQDSACALENREELLALLRQLKAELATLEKTQPHEARSITGHTVQLARAAEDQRNPEIFKRSLQDLMGSVESFGESHPQLVQLINRIATTLANLGI
jgi:hypothetical protein